MVLMRGVAIVWMIHVLKLKDAASNKYGIYTLIQKEQEYTYTFYTDA